MSVIERIEIQQWIAENFGISFAAHLEIKNKRINWFGFRFFWRKFILGRRKVLLGKQNICLTLRNNINSCYTKTIIGDNYFKTK